MSCERQGLEVGDSRGDEAVLQGRETGKGKEGLAVCLW